MNVQNFKHMVISENFIIIIIIIIIIIPIIIIFQSGYKYLYDFTKDFIRWIDTEKIV